MFSKGNAKPAGAAPAMPAKSDPVRASSGNVPPSIISTDMKIVGELRSQGDLQIDGQVEGDIHSQSITVGESASILGSITAANVRICGAVTGEINGETVTLTRTAKVLGDILSRTLAIEPGAMLDGRCRNKDQAPTDARPFVVHSGKDDQPPSDPGARMAG